MATYRKKPSYIRMYMAMIVDAVMYHYHETRWDLVVVFMIGLVGLMTKAWLASWILIIISVIIDWEKEHDADA